MTNTNKLILKKDDYVFMACIVLIGEILFVVALYLILYVLHYLFVFIDYMKKKPNFQTQLRSHFNYNCV